MAVTKEEKTRVLDGLRDQFGRAKGTVFAEFRGLSVIDTQTVRRGLREAGLEYKVAKKTLIKLAAKENGYDLPDEILEGPIGVAFGFDDEVLAAQKMAEFAKKFEGLTLKGGLMEGRVIDVTMVNILASIPSREVLLAKFMGSALAPITGFVGIGSGLISGFVRVVNAYREQRGEADGIPVTSAPVAEEAATEPAPEPVAEEAAEGPTSAMDTVAEPTPETGEPAPEATETPAV